MAFVNLQPNQMVSFTDAQSGGFSLNSGQSHTTSNQCMTKSDALTKYNLVASNMAAYANNQLVPKSTWVSNALAYNYYFSSYSNATSAGSCATFNDGATIVHIYSSSQLPLSIGNVFYTDTALTIPFNGGSLFWGWLNGDAIVPGTKSSSTYQISSAGVIQDIITCYSVYSYLLSVGGYNTPSESCSAVGDDFFSVYSTSSSLSIGTVLYTNSSLANGSQVNGGGFYYQMNELPGSVAQINSSGEILDILSCSALGNPQELTLGNYEASVVCGDSSFYYGWYTAELNITVGSKIYYDQALSQPVDGGSMFFKNINNNVAYLIDSFGNVSTSISC